MLTQRLKILSCSTHFFLLLMKSGCKFPVKIINPLPEDATIVRIYQEGYLNNIKIIIASESFPELNDGDPIPLIDMPLFEEVR